MKGIMQDGDDIFKAIAFELKGQRQQIKDSSTMKKSKS